MRVQSPAQSPTIRAGTQSAIAARRGADGTIGYAERANLVLHARSSARVTPANVVGTLSRTCW